MKTIVQLVSELKDYLIEKDTAAKQAVESNIASVETDASSASKAYAVGQQLVLNDILYDVIDSIAIEDSLVVGTNIQVADKVSVAIAELASQNETLTNKAYLTDDTAITEVASDDLLPIYDTSATAKKKIAVSNFVGGLVSNPNLLDNPWFTVNQRGASSYAGSSERVYTFDRWYINAYSPDITVTDNNDGTITISNTGSSDNLQFAQLLESDILISGKTYNLTCDVVAYTGSVRMLLAGNISPYPSIINKLVDKTGYLNAKGVYDGTSNTYKVSFSLDANSSITIRAVKLEIGDISTLAMDTAPNYTTELLKCQRYFVRLACPNNYYTFNGIIGYVSADTSVAKMGITLGTPLRANPTVNVSDVSKFQIASGGTFKTLSTLTASGLASNTLSFEVGMTGSGAFSAYEIALMIRTTKDEYIDLSADL